MAVPRPDVLFRLIGVLAAINVAIPQLVRSARIGGVPGAVSAFVQVGLCGLFVGAFWASTRGRPTPRLSTRTVALFATQVAVALAEHHYLVIVAAASAWLFAPPTALRWLIAQLGLFVTMSIMPLWVDVGPYWIGLGVFVPDTGTVSSTVAMVTVIAYLAGWQCFAFGVGFLAAGERRASVALQRKTQELVATQQMLTESSRFAERTQISRELHDTLGHSLAVLNVNLELASHLSQGRAAEVVARARTVGRLLMADVREVVHTLGQNGAIDLRAALTTLVNGAEAPRVHLSMPARLALADPSAAHAVFRCVQEGLTNAMRHGQATTVWVRLSEDDDRLRVQVRDDGLGVDDPLEGYGLRGMRERLESVGGGCRVQTALGTGFVLEAWVPMTTERA